MNQNTNSAQEDTSSTSDYGDLAAREALTEILRAGAQKMLKAAIEQEVSDYVNERIDIVDDGGQKLIVRNGSLPKREILTGIGPVTVKQLRVRDKRHPVDREIFQESLCGLPEVWEIAESPLHPGQRATAATTIVRRITLHLHR